MSPSSPTWICVSRDDAYWSVVVVCCYCASRVVIRFLHDRHPVHLSLPQRIHHCRRRHGHDARSELCDGGLCIYPSGAPCGLQPGRPNGSYYSATSAASRAPSSQQASRSFLPGGPVTVTGGRIARHCRPVVIDSTARTAPVVAMPPCTYRP